MTVNFLICNPLPEALQHYATELRQTLERSNLTSGMTVGYRVEDAPGLIGNGLKLARALGNSRYRRDSASSSTIQCWPSLGLLEPILWRNVSRRNLVVFHDPVPIRKQVGFDSFSRTLARCSGGRSAPTVVVHSDDAFREAARCFPKLTIRKALHPLLTEVDGTPNPTGEVVVAGQFKPERNLALLASIGPALRSRGLRPRIYGRGWPSVPGWEVDSRFLAEAELDEAIDRAAVLLIPYRNYFQSGIAIRALERGKISVSPENSFARDVFGSFPQAIYPALAAPEEVLERLIYIASTTASPLDIFKDYQKRVDASWLELANSL